MEIHYDFFLMSYVQPFYVQALPHGAAPEVLVNVAAANVMLVADVPRNEEIEK